MHSYERVYVLALEKHKFYVGTTLREIHVRYQEHFDRGGSLDVPLPAHTVHLLDGGYIPQDRERTYALLDVDARLDQHPRGRLGFPAVPLQKLVTARDAPTSGG